MGKVWERNLSVVSHLRRGRRRLSSAGSSILAANFATMELRPWIALLLALTAIVARTQALLLTVQNTECVWEDVEYDGDIVSGNFVVLDHDVFWGSDHPGIELLVRGSQTSSLNFCFLKFFL